jgi:hypothetical protein
MGLNTRRPRCRRRLSHHALLLPTNSLLGRTPLTSGTLALGGSRVRSNLSHFRKPGSYSSSKQGGPRHDTVDDYFRVMRLSPRGKLGRTPLTSGTSALGEFCLGSVFFSFSEAEKLFELEAIRPQARRGLRRLSRHAPLLPTSSQLGRTPLTSCTLLPRGPRVTSDSSHYWRPRSYSNSK